MSIFFFVQTCAPRTYPRAKGRPLPKARRATPKASLFAFEHTPKRSQNNKIIKMFSLTQSASFASTKVSAAAPKQSTKRSAFKVQAKAINSESLSKRDFLSAAVLSFGFLSVGDADAATKKVRKSYASKRTPASAKKYPTAKKSTTAKPYKPSARTVVPARSVATSPASRRGRAAPAKKPVTARRK